MNDKINCQYVHVQEKEKRGNVSIKSRYGLKKEEDNNS